MNFPLKEVLICAALMLYGIGASAQSSLHLDRSQERRGSSKLKTGTESMILLPQKDADSPALKFKDYKDDSFEALDSEMKERQLMDEDEAWKRACELDSCESYETFIARFPGGKHVAEASCRLIDVKVEETLRDAHEDLPNIKHTEPAEPTLTSTVIITNNTGLPLTVYCSGTDRRSVTIPEGGRITLTIGNGDYKIAASVPPKYIRPFAGKTTFVGGTYEIGFWVVRSSY